MSENSEYPDKEALRKLFAGGFNRATTDETFRQHFEKYGVIVDLVIIKDMNQQSRGFGYVTYDHPDAVKAALDDRPHVIDNKNIEVKRAIPIEEKNASSHLKTKRLFVGGLPSNINEDILTDYFNTTYKNHGVVEKCELIRNRGTGELRGFGFLEVSSEDLADLIIISEPKPTILGKKVEIKKCEEKGGGGGGQPGGRGGRGGSRGGGRGGYGGGRGGYGGGNQSGGGYWGGGGNMGGGGMYGGYNQGGMYASGGYGQDYATAFTNSNYGNYGGGYSGGYDQMGYGQPNAYGGAGGAGGGRDGRAGGGRYRPY